MESRKCIDCGNWHNTVIENTRTGEVEEYLDKCRECIFKGCLFLPISYPIHIEALDKSEKPIADQLAAMVNHLTQTHDIYDQEIMVPFRAQYEPPPRDPKWDFNYWRNILKEFPKEDPPPKLLTYKKLVDS